jgi:hypothetical protein
MVKQAFQQQAKDTTQKEKFVGASNGDAVSMTPEQTLAEEDRKKHQAELVDKSELLKGLWNAGTHDKEFEAQLKSAQVVKTGDNSLQLGFADGSKILWETADGAEYLGTMLEKGQDFTEKEARHIIKACKSHGWKSIHLHGTEGQHGLMSVIAAEEGLEVKSGPHEDALKKSFDVEQQKKYNLQETAQNAGEYFQDLNGGETYKEWLQRKTRERMGKGKDTLQKRIDKAAKAEEDFAELQTAFLERNNAEKPPEELVGQLRQLEQLLGTKIIDEQPVANEFDKWFSQKIDNANSTNNTAQASTLQNMRELLVQNQAKLTPEQQSSFMNYVDKKQDTASVDAAVDYLKNTFGVQLDINGPKVPAPEAAIAETRTPTVINAPKYEPRPPSVDKTTTT